MVLPGISPNKPVISSIAGVIGLSNAMKSGQFPASRISNVQQPSLPQPQSTTQPQQSKMLSKAKVQEILANRPAGVDPSEILVGLQQKGYVLEGLTPTQQPTAMQDMLQPAGPIARPSVITNAVEAIKGGGKYALPAAGAVVGGLLAGKVGGEVLKAGGKALYGATLPPTAQEAGMIQSSKAGLTEMKPVTTVQTALDQPFLQKGGTTLSSKVGMMGTRSGIGVQAAARAKEIGISKIEPFFQKAAEKGITASYSDIMGSAIKAVEGAKGYSTQMKGAIVDDIKSLFEGMNGTTDLKNLDLLSQEIRNKVPTKYLQGEKSTKTLTEAQKYVQKAMKGKIYDVAKEMGDNVAKAYVDYGNLKGLAKMGRSAMTQAGRKGGAFGGLSWVFEELLTPGTTIVGKTIYRAGEAISSIPNKVISLVKKAGTSIGSMSVGETLGTIIKEAPAGILAQTFGDMIKKSADEIRSGEAVKNDITSAIKNLSSGKDIDRASKYARIATKGMDKKTALKYLTKVLSTIK